MRLPALITLPFVVVVVGVGCFEPDLPPEPTKDPVGVISGRIIVAQSTAQSAPDINAVIAARDVVASAWPDVPATTVDHLDVTPADALPPPDFVAGAAIILFERTAYDQVTLVPVLEKMRRAADPAAGLTKVQFTITRCVAKFMCTFKMSDDEGYLDEERTAVAIDALHKVKARKIKRVGRNEIQQGFRVPNDPFFAQQWHMSQIKLPAAWDLSIGNPDLVVAVVDSGIVHNNPDLRAKIARDPNNPNIFIEQDFVDVSASNDGDGPDFDAEDPGDNLLGPNLHSFHGTHVAGIIGAQTNNAVGVAGVMWNVQILPVRVLGDKLTGSLDDIIAGLFWAVGDPDTGRPINQRPAKVVNLSLGGTTTPSSQETWENAVDIIFTDPDNTYDDPILICAAGNAAVNAASVVPANIPRMITVGGNRADGLRASYSNFGGPIDVMAPGGQLDLDLNNDDKEDGVLSTVGVDLGLQQGTSMSAPHVTGIAGLLISSKPDLSHDQIHDLITETADIRFMCNEGCGKGLVDAVQALIAAGVEVEPTPRLALEVNRVVFGSGVDKYDVKLLNLGSAAAPFTVSLERSQAELFSVTPLSGLVVPASSANRGVDLTIELDRGEVLVGSAVLVVRGTGAAAGQEVSATLSFDTNPGRGRLDLQDVDVGVFSRADGVLKRVGGATAIAGNNFAWTIGGLAAGSYEVYAVGDDNHDGTFDRQRESFGAWRGSTTVEQVVVKDEAVPVEGIDFPVVLPPQQLSVRGVGATCTSDEGALTECSDILAFAPSAGCITNYPGGYCSRDCEDDSVCGGDGTCVVLGCGADGQTPCSVCLKNCVADSQCRDDYLCILNTCVPGN